MFSELMLWHCQCIKTGKNFKKSVVRPKFHKWNMEKILGQEIKIEIIQSLSLDTADMRTFELLDSISKTEIVLYDRCK